MTHEQEALTILRNCLETAQECQCTDPPETRPDDDERGNDPDDPECHQQFCPVYLLAVVLAGISGEEFPA